MHQITGRCIVATHVNIMRVATARNMRHAQVQVRDILVTNKCTYAGAPTAC